jgi:hypothetical protein
MKTIGLMPVLIKNLAGIYKILIAIIGANAKIISINIAIQD